jgi:hypothetical protein
VAESTPGPFTCTLQGSGVVTADEVDVETGEVNGNGEDMKPSVTSIFIHPTGLKSNT